MSAEAPIGFPDFELTDFRFLSVLGRGGMGTVYLGEQFNPSRKVAIKVVTADTAPRAFLEQLRNEGNLAAQFEHPNLVTVYQCGIVDNHYYLAMQYLPGGDLQAKLGQGMDHSETLRVVRAIAAGLAHIHQNGYVHRDIKPANVLFSAQNEPVLVDFGIAKSTKTVGALTQAGYATGTPAYMSPEQIKGLPIDGRADLYSLGIVLYECLSGERPFQADSDYDLRDMQVNAPPPPLPAGQSRFQPVLDRLLAKQPGDRFASTERCLPRWSILAAANRCRRRWSKSTTATTRNEPRCAPLHGQGQGSQGRNSGRRAWSRCSCLLSHISILLQRGVSACAMAATVAPNWATSGAPSSRCHSSTTHTLGADYRPLIAAA